MAHHYTSYYDKPDNNRKRYATTAIVLAGALVGGSYISSYAAQNQTNYGRPFTYGGQRYYVPGDSRRAVYPSKEACQQDVPIHLRGECEPVTNYTSGRIGSWYGPVYTPRDTYQPGSQYPTEQADSTNVGKRLPSGANTDGFGSNGKAFTGSKGG